jgi:recombination protein RecT
MTDVIQHEPQVPTWPQLVGKVQQRFDQIASRHKLVTWAEESQFAIQAIQANEKLFQCEPRTVQNAIINVASIGLTLQPALGYAYLVPESVKYKDQNNKEYWVQECSLKVSFKGLMKIATDSGSIKWCKAEVVKEKDTFEYKGPCSMPNHIMQPFADRGATVGVYCIAKTHDGDYLVDIMGSAEIAKIKNAAKTKYVWDAWPDEMAKKAIIKRASKQWPKTDQSDRLDQAIEVVNEYEGSESMDVTQKAERLDKPREKEKISDERLTAAITKINSGEYTKEALERTFALTDHQLGRVMSEVQS